MTHPVVIGAGLGALAFGAQMARIRPDIPLLVIDKHHVPGGYASVFRRKGTRFDCSLHKLSGMKGDGNMRRVFRTLDLLGELDLADSDALFHTVRGDRVLPLSAPDADAVRGNLLGHFPHEVEGIDRVFRETAVHGRNGYLLFRILAGEFKPDLEELQFARRHLSRLTVAEALAERVGDPLLREVLGASCIYVGAFPEELNYLYYLHLLYATLFCGNVYVRGGSERLAGALVRRIEAAGGEVRLRTEATRVVCEGGRAVAVETKSGRFDAGRVYINACPRFALDHLFAGTPGLEESRRRLAELVPSFSTTTLYVETDTLPGDLGVPAAECMLVPDGFAGAAAARAAHRVRPADPEAAADAFWRLGTAQVTDYARLDPSGGNVLCLNVLDAIDHWPERRSPEYRDRKEEAQRHLVARLMAAFPGVRGRVRWAEVATPRTYLRYTYNHRGAGYGAITGREAPRRPFHAGFPIPNVEFLSAWVAGPTYEAALGYAELAAQRFPPD
jgi:phytoene dehydrogenase-like protein